MIRRFTRRNHGTEAPSHLVFVDTESIIKDVGGPTKRKSLTLRLWCASRVRIENGEPTRRIEECGLTPDSFWQWLDEISCDQRCTWVFAHNLPFDLTQLDFWAKLDSKWFVTEPLKCKPKEGEGQCRNSWVGKLCLDDRPTFVVVRHNRKTYKFVDTLNYWPTALWKIGESAGLAKLPMPSENDHYLKWWEYCRRDVDIIEHAVTGLVQNWAKEDCGVFQMTAASLAYTNWRHTCDIRTPDGECVDVEQSPDAKSHELERECYFGGRTQAFFVGKLEGEIYHLDCNSLYPYVMRDNSYPRRFVEYRDGLKIGELAKIAECNGVCARVAIKSRHGAFPVRIDEKQYHVVGNYWASLSGPELRRAIDTECIARVGTVQWYSVAPIFRKWVDYWYERKMQADATGKDATGEREFSKTILCSLSGKFAQHGRKWVDRHGEIPLVRWGGYYDWSADTGKGMKKRGIAGNCQELTESGEPQHAFPLISAYITAYAREYMRSCINMAGEDNVYYMATDSIITNADGYARMLQAGLVDQSQLGKFKLLGVYRSCEIFGSNHYKLGDRIVQSGPQANARRDERGILRGEIWERTSGIISRGPVRDVIVTEVAFHEPEHDYRGRIGEDGRWSPYRLSLDIDFTDSPRKGGYFAESVLDMV